MCLMHRVCGRVQASTAGLQHAPSGSVDAVERVTRGLRIEGLAAASASTLTRGACRLISCIHHRRAHGLLVPASITHGVEHGEGRRGEHRAVVGLAGTVGGEQRCRTARLAGDLPRKVEVGVRTNG